MSLLTIESTPQWFVNKEYMLYINLIVLSSILIVLWLHWLWSRRHLYRFTWTIPGEVGLPFIGIMLHIKKANNALPYMEQLYKKFKTYTVHMWMGVYPMIITSDPDFIKKILLSPKLLNKHEIYKVFKDMFGNGLLSSPAGEWQIHRKKINPSFNHQMLLSFFPIFNKAKNNIVKELKTMVDDKKTYGLEKLFLQASMGISFETVMGKPLNENNKINTSFVENFIFIVHKSTIKGLMILWKLDFLFILYRKYAQAHEIYKKFILELVRERILKANSQREETTIRSQCNKDQSENIHKTPQIFVDQVLKEFSSEDVLSEATHIVGASFETSAASVFSTLVFLAMHPLIQERLYEELISVFPDKDFCMAHQHMDQLPYLEMVIKESMRVFPPVPLIGRRVNEDTKIDGDTFLPKGLGVIVSIYHLHRRPDIWGQDADKFDPDHFLPDNERDRHKFAYLPFSGGSRNCIGWRYALFLVSTMIAGIIRNYRLETDTKYSEIEIDLNMTLKFKEEPLIRIFSR